MESPNTFRTSYTPVRPYTQTEVRELSALISDYVRHNQQATDAELVQGIETLGMLYDFALELRWLPPDNVA